APAPPFGGRAGPRGEGGVGGGRHNALSRRGTPPTSPYQGGHSAGSAPNTNGDHLGSCLLRWSDAEHTDVAGAHCDDGCDVVPGDRPAGRFAQVVASSGTADC